MGSICRSCDAPIVWVETEATERKPGRKMPVDADPENPSKARRAPYVVEATGEKIDTGNLIFTKERTGSGTWIVRYVKKGPGLFVSHFATCPNRGEHRKP